VGPQASGASYRAAIVRVNERDRVLCVNRANADDHYGKQSCRRLDKNNWVVFSYLLSSILPRNSSGEVRKIFSELEKSGSMSWGELSRE
jgi:hypothetical protein